MTDSRTTERLMAMLEERGVEYKVKEDFVTVRIGDKDANFSDFKDGLMCMTLSDFVTPEQAIAATLGSGTLGQAVKCIDCESYAEADGIKFCARVDYETEPDGFCAWAKRKEVD